MLILNDVSVSIGKKAILTNISCTVESGDFIVIVGANGAGKSTLFDLIAGRRKAGAGTIILDNVDITSWSEQQRAALIGRLLQDPNLNTVASMTVRQNLALAQLKGRRARLVNGMTRCSTELIISLKQELGLDLTPLLDVKLASLSGGQRQLIAFIMAILTRPKLLLLDEPTAALDPQAATILLSFAIKYLKNHRIPTLLITHDQDLARTIGNKLWVIDHGRISRQLSGAAKENADPQELAGHIDYAGLAALK